MKNWVVNLINGTIGKAKDFKLVKAGNSVIKICTKPEMDLKKIKKDFPNGVPEGHSLHGYA